MTTTYFNNGCTKTVYGSGEEIWKDENNRIHRLDDPARILKYYDYNDGQKVEFVSNEWYWRGKRISCSSQREFEKFVRLRAFL